jgi:hypothetical protein
MPKEKIKAKLEKTKQTKLNKYGNENYNNRDSAKQTCLNRFGTTSPLANKKIYEQTQLTREKLYGSKNYVETNSFKEQKAKTQLERYGNATFTNREKADSTFKANHNGLSFSEYSSTEECKTKTAKTNIKLYGGISPVCSQDVKEKIYKTKTERYGDPHYTNFEKTKQTKLERYDNPYYNNPTKQSETAKKYGSNYSSVFQVPEIHEKAKDAMFKKYGVRYPTQYPPFLDKACKTKMERYNNPYYTNTEKISQTKLNRYGRIGGFSYKYNYFGIMFDSSWELAVWIYCIDHGIPIIRCPFIYTYLDSNNKEKKYYLDFWINGKLVEIKGDHFKNNKNQFESPYNNNETNTQNMLAKQKIIKEKGIEVWYEKDCEMYIQYARYKYGYYFYHLFNTHNPTNPSYACLNGYTNLIKPYINIKISYSYPVFNNKGITPYDLSKQNYIMPTNSKGVTPYNIGLTK